MFISVCNRKTGEEIFDEVVGYHVTDVQDDTCILEVKCKNFAIYLNDGCCWDKIELWHDRVSFAYTFDYKTLKYTGRQVGQIMRTLRDDDRHRDEDAALLCRQMPEKMTRKDLLDVIRYLAVR